MFSHHSVYLNSLLIDLLFSGNSDSDDSDTSISSESSGNSPALCVYCHKELQQFEFNICQNCYNSTFLDGNPNNNDDSGRMDNKIINEDDSGHMGHSTMNNEEDDLATNTLEEVANILMSIGNKNSVETEKDRKMMDGVEGLLQLHDANSTTESRYS